MKKKFKENSIIVLILFLGFIYHQKYVTEFPSHIHAWAQSDRYALSLGFLDNGLNFFKPQTFVYNHQFPHNWKMPSIKTITAVDFPVHDYIPALLMKVTGNNSPGIFRIYILLFSLVGLFFLFKLAYIITNSYLKSLFIVIFTTTSPVYVYYQGGFLPTIPSLSNTIIAVYFYYRHLQEDKHRYFILSILFITLAALSRTTFVIPLIALLCIEFIRIIKKETNLITKLIPVSISILSILFYFLYNDYLRRKYGSIFLNHILPPDSITHAKEILRYVYDNWVLQYFTKPHYFVFIAAILLSVIFIVVRKTGIPKVNGYFSFFSITYLFGCIIFAVLMLRQFPAHDYYFLDTFFLPVILILLLFLSLIPNTEKKYLKISSFIVTSFISGLLIIQPIKSQEKRRETGFWDRTEATINNYKYSSAFLDSLRIPKSSKMLVIDAVAPNIPFILMQRKGYAVMNTSEENIEEALTWDYDYIVVQNEYFIPEVYTLCPDILPRLNKIADNGKISVCRLSEGKNKQSLRDFFGLNEKKPVFEKSVTFENISDSLWQNINSSHKYAFSDSLSGHLTSDIIYGLTYKTKYLPGLKNNSRTLFFSSYFLRETIVNCEIVTSINTDGQNIYYKSYNLKNLIKKETTWEKVSLTFQLPKVQSNDYEFAIFLWNTGKSELYYDNFTFSIY